MTRFQDCQILTGMALRGCDIANATVAMLVPVYEVVALVLLCQKSHLQQSDTW